MKHAVIENGVVVNIVIADADFASKHGLVKCTGIEMGYSYDGATFTAPTRDLESEWAKVRVHRGALLTESDAFVLPDRWASMSAEQQAKWSTYRQALRDLPATFGDPANITWPIMPV